MSENDRPRTDWQRGAVAVAVYVAASLAYAVAFITPNTSWEHHPFAGPLVALFSARHAHDLAVGLAIWLGLGAGLCGPAFRPSPMAVLLCVCSAAAWIALSLWAAATASC